MHTNPAAREREVGGGRGVCVCVMVAWWVGGCVYRSSVQIRGVGGAIGCDKCSLRLDLAKTM